MTRWTAATAALRESTVNWIFEDKYEVCLKVLPISVTWIALNCLPGEKHTRSPSTCAELTRWEYNIHFFSLPSHLPVNSLHTYIPARLEPGVPNPCKNAASAAISITWDKQLR